jgi:hypothetical protein
MLNYGVAGWFEMESKKCTRMVMDTDGETPGVVAADGSGSD